MSNGFVQREGVLKRAANDVAVATKEVEALCKKLDGQIKGQTGWGGSGRAALDNVNIQWQEKQRVILGALQYLSDALDVTDRETVALDDDVAAANSRMANMLNS